MKIHFYLRYTTRHGQALFIQRNEQEPPLPMEYIDDEFWHGILELPGKLPRTLNYHYQLREPDGHTRIEFDHDRSLELAGFKADSLQVMDHWNEPGAVENVFYTQPFQQIYNPPPAAPSKSSVSRQRSTHLFKVKAPLLNAGEVVCLLGHGVDLRNWDSAAPLLLRPEGNWWSIRLDLSKEDFPLGYKYGLWNTRTNKFLGFETGSNRTLYGLPSATNDPVEAVLHDGFMRRPLQYWRGAGVAIPVFSLRTRKSFGVGEFTDLTALADWASGVGLKILQLLPVNDTSAHWAGGGEARPFWTDSYPYSAISAFALHPLYLNLEQLAGQKHAARLKPYAKKQAALNALEAVDYEGVVAAKWEMIRLLYPVLKEEWRNDPAYQAYFAENKHWLVSYAAFCYLRDKNGTTDFNQWPVHSRYEETSIAQLVSPQAAHYDEVAIHYFVQWHLHLQLKAAADYAHGKGLALKGDIPIGIYRYSCDAWVAPDLYNMDQQAGAPPDDFAEKGQNWGFPTYNWARMKQDGFAWWRQRFAQMRLYFDAFRIDHILGFFRIWSIPLDAVEGILGRFVPAIAVTENEFHEAGIGFNFNRFCKPFITDQILQERFGEAAGDVKAHFLEAVPESDGERYVFKPLFDTQRKLEAYFETNELASAQPGTAAVKSKTKKTAKPAWSPNQEIKAILFDLISNVLLYPDPDPGGYHFRFGIEKTASFHYMPEEIKGKMKALYVNYFYRRQDDFWEREAMEKLPALKRSTNMLICGEDLGMVPHCVPQVMQELGILSLEIQRMPKAAGAAFFHPKDAPYLSVVTPSTHDMSTIRGWWEEDRQLSQRFFNELLGYTGNAPYFCEPWLNRLIIAQHFHSPAMLAIFQLQDLLGSDGALRRENPGDERINIPANPKHYWRYRMHIVLEDLMGAEGFNRDVRNLVEESGRG